MWRERKIPKGGTECLSGISLLGSILNRARGYQPRRKTLESEDSMRAPAAEWETARMARTREIDQRRDGVALARLGWWTWRPVGVIKIYSGNLLS